MKYVALDDHTFAVRLEIWESVHAVLESFATEHSVQSASVQGIGSFESPTLAHYSVKSKQYSKHVIPGVLEVTSLLGNISILDGKPLVHLHATVAGSDMAARAGHLAQGTCSATLELIVTTFDTTLAKAKSQDVGLNLWDF